MQHITRITLLLAAAWVGSHAVREHPIGKVITLLKKLSAEVKSEGQKEEVSYQRFVYWCKTSSSKLAGAIQEEMDTIDTLSSTIEGKTKILESLGADLKSIGEQVAELKSADAAAGKDDTARTVLYKAKAKNLAATIKAMDEAIKALQDAAKSTDAKLLLSQHKLAQNHVRDMFALIATVASEGEQSSLMNFIQDEADPKAAGDYDKHTKKYSFKSNSVTELLKNLKMKFADDLTAATVAETNAANSHVLTKAARDATLKATKASAMQKFTDEGDTDGELRQAKSDLANENADLKADSSALKATKDKCSMKHAEWQDRTRLRTQELGAMAAGIRVLAKVSGVRSEAPTNPGLPTAPVTLLQAMSMLQSMSSPQARAVQLLKATAKMYHSKALERLAVEVSTHVPNQFQDIINQVQKMIFRLKQEQIDEDNHKLWCDSEVAKTAASISDKDDKKKELEAKIKEIVANVALLTGELAAAEKMMSDIKKFQMEATQIRNTGKRENTIAIADAQEATTAITNAMQVLSTFYKDSGEITKEPWEFLQQPASLPKDPATWDSPYTGLTDPTKAGTGVITVLKAISADFSKMEADSRAQEVTDDKEYRDTMRKQNIELARRRKESEMKSAEKGRLVQKTKDLTSQKKHVTDELDSTAIYLKDLEPACFSGESSHKDRKAARAAEIKALGEAQTILDEAFKAQATKKSAAFLQTISMHT